MEALLRQSTCKDPLCSRPVQLRGQRKETLALLQTGARGDTNWYPYFVIVQKRVPSKETELHQGFHRRTRGPCAVVTKPGHSELVPKRDKPAMQALPGCRLGLANRSMAGN